MPKGLVSRASVNHHWFSHAHQHTHRRTFLPLWIVWHTAVIVILCSSTPPRSWQCVPLRMNEVMCKVYMLVCCWKRRHFTAQLWFLSGNCLKTQGKIEWQEWIGRVSLDNGWERSRWGYGRKKKKEKWLSDCPLWTLVLFIWWIKKKQFQRV